MRFVPVASAVAALLVMILVGIVGSPVNAAFGKNVRYGTSGWEGYGWNASDRVSCNFVVPTITGPDGAVAFWAGFGQGNPGIQQTGVAANKSGSKVTWQAWYEMWPADQHPFGKTIKTGDTLQFIVTRSGYTYTLSVNNVTQNWSASTKQYSKNIEPGGEAVAEAFGPPLPNFSAARFQYTNKPIVRSWIFPFTGTTMVKTNANSFYIKH